MFVLTRLARLLLLLFVLSPFLLLLPSTQGAEAADPLAEPEAEAAQTLYLPAISRQGPRSLTFGGEIRAPFLTPVTAWRAESAHLSLIRYNRVSWAEVEPTPGQRNWGALNDELEDLALLASYKMLPMVIVTGAPEWARVNPAYECGPIKADALNAYATFVHELVLRLSKPPYNVYYYEMGNEPDVHGQAVPDPNSGFGCWGDLNDPYYGGGHYGQMLKAVYPAVKAANRQAVVVTGGLLLDCDPTNSNCLAGKFLEGMLQDPAVGNSFDMLAYHAYTFARLDGQLPTYDWDLNFEKWRPRGGILLGKLQFIKQVMARYGVDKPVIMNEGTLICPSHTPGTCPEAMYDQAATYAVRLYARTLANDLVGSLWYTVDGPGWRDGGLLNPVGQVPRPAYHAVEFLARNLSNAQHVATLYPPNLEGLEGYRYSNYHRSYKFNYEIYWSNKQGVTGNVAIPQGARVYDKLGQQIDTAGMTNYTVGWEPVIVQYAVPAVTEAP